MKNFYKLIPDDNKEAGLLTEPQDWPVPIVQDGVPVKEWNPDYILTLSNGKYRPYDYCIGGAKMIDEDLKDLFQSYIGDDQNVEFLPVTANSNEYGNRKYYIVHFKQVYSDVIDKKHSRFLNGRVVTYGLTKEKVKDLKVFTVKGNDILVCPEIAAEMKKRKLNFGIELFPIRCYKESE